jgi:integrase
LPTPEQGVIKAALRWLTILYADESIKDFGPKALKAVRNGMLEGDLSRQTINKFVDRIKRMFCWGVEEELVPETVYRALLAVKGLEQGRTAAREAEPVEKVDDAIVELTLPHLTRTVSDMIQVQRLAAMRPAEVCIMRPCDIDRSGEVWIYRPATHKTEHKGKRRLVYIGPKAQEVLLPYLLRDPQSYCFSPQVSEQKRRAEQHENRKTPVSCGTKPGDRRKRRPQRSPGDRYTTASYRRAIHRACDRAFPPPAQVARAKGETTTAWYRRLKGVSKEILAEHYATYRWSPNQLRHSMASDVEKQFGIEHARVMLGHASVSTTELYAEMDRQKGVEVAKRIG